MGVAAEIVEDLLGAAERSFGVDDPFGLAQRSQMGGEGRRLGERGEVSEEVQAPASKAARNRSRNSRR